MAFSGIATRGSATEQISDTSIGVTSLSAAIAVGKIAIVCCVTDNDSTAVADGASTRHSSVSDSKSNTWNKVAEYTDSDGAAADGVTISMWWSKITTQIETTDTITLTVSAAVSDKIITCFEVTVAAGKTVSVSQVGLGQSAVSASVSGLASLEYLLVGHGGAEGTDSTKTPDADYTERYDLRTASSGSPITAHVQTRIATLTSDTVTSTTWTNTNPVTILVAFREILLPVAVAQISETDTAQTIAGQRVKPVAQISETDTAQALSRQWMRTVAQISETDEAQAINRQKIMSVGLVSETDEARPITLGASGAAFSLSLSSNITASGENTTAQLTPPAGKTGANFEAGRIQDDENPADAVNLTDGAYTEVEWSLTSTASAVEGEQYEFRVTVNGTPFYSYSVLPVVTISAAVPVNQATETDLAQPFTSRKIVPVGQVTETDSAQTITRSKQKATGQNSETDSAQAITRQKVRAVGQNSETDSAQAITFVSAAAVSQASETDSAQAITARKIKAVAQVSETDAAQAISAVAGVLIQQVEETDIAQALFPLKRVSVVLVSETDSAQAITRQKVIAVGQVTETDSAQAVTGRKSKVTGQASETDAAQTITPAAGIPVGQVGETDLAQALFPLKRVLVAQVVETDSALAIERQAVPGQGKSPFFVRYVVPYKRHDKYRSVR